MHDVDNDQPRHGDLLTPLSLLHAGNIQACRRFPVHTFPGGGLTAGLHSSVFMMNSQPVAADGARTPPRSAAKVTPDPLQVMGRRR